MNQAAFALGDVLLRSEHVSLAFGDYELDEHGFLKAAEKLVLNDVNLEIHDITRPGMITGQVVGLLGPSGIGKTCFARIIAGLDIPTTGQVLLHNGQPTKAGIVGFVFQNYPLFEDRTVIANLVLAGRQVGLSRAKARDKAMAYLERFKIAQCAKQWPRELSGGQRQRVSIIQQVLCSEYFIVFDEPFSGLDPLMREETIAVVKEIVNEDEKNTAIIITHDVSAAVCSSDRLLLVGRDFDPATHNPVPGARIKYTFDLVALGLAWRTDLYKDPKFLEFVGEIESMFHEL
ncbi:MAG: ATP-binding cassette domain-containing protein [Gallionella sp.]|nr:ATP-binding cassette domain-containing protein [Gallionella sp.]